MECAWFRSGSRRVLHLGCAGGDETFVMAEAYGTATAIVGIDPRPDLVDLARGRARQVALALDFEVGGGASLPGLDASFDLVRVDADVLSERSLQSVAAEVQRVLRRDGLLVVEGARLAETFRAHLRELAS